MSEFIANWIEPSSVIPAIIALISSGLLPFLLHKYKVRRERDEKLFETRKTEYQAYFKKMEEAARLAGQDYDKFLKVTMPEATLNLYRENSSPESIVEYQRVMNDFTQGINDGFQKASNELVSLRIVCSSSLANLLDEFEETYKEMMLLQPQMLSEIKSSITAEAFLTGQFNFDTPSKLVMVELGEKLVLTRNNIIMTMRQELGYKD